MAHGRLVCGCLKRSKDMIGEALLSLAAIGAGGAVGKKLFNAACYGIKRFLEP